jgi:aminoglycoside phosphotransferase family enzyme
MTEPAPTSFKRSGRTAEVAATLRNPAAFPTRPSGVTPLETHMAWVFLTDKYAYKLKKPVQTSYLDFSTPAKRTAACEAEMRLNIHLAPWVYLGMVPMLANAQGNLRLEGAEGAPVEWLVKMRRLPAERMLDAAIRAGTATPRAVIEAAELVAQFFRDQAPLPLAPDAYVTAVKKTIHADAAAIRDAGDDPRGPRAIDLAERLADVVARHADLVGSRAERRIAGHGDLRPEHVALGPPPAVIDCVEFNREFRLLDPAEEIAFLHLECTRLGADWVGEAFLDPYRRFTGDAPPPTLIAIYAAKRALLRAKLALWHLDDTTADPAPWRALADSHLDLADGFLAQTP